MTFQARGRIDPAVDPVLGQVIPTVRQRALRRILELVARLELFLVGMAV